MNIIIFDIDGTLTQTTVIDSECFVKAVCNYLQLNKLNTNWEEYQYSTDSGVLTEIYQTLFKRDPCDLEVDAIRESFLENLESAWQSDHQHFTAITGAEQILVRINQLKDWHIGIATGTWERSALFKLNRAAINHHQSLPKAFADDHVERFEIIRKTLERAQTMYSISDYQRKIYVGDKDWDHRAAKTLGMEFIGIGKNFANKDDINLQLTDYCNHAQFLDYLHRSR